MAMTSPLTTTTSSTTPAVAVKSSADLLIPTIKEELEDQDSFEGDDDDEDEEDDDEDDQDFENHHHQAIGFIIKPAIENILSSPSSSLSSSADAAESPGRIGGDASGAEEEEESEESVSEFEESLLLGGEEEDTFHLQNTNGCPSTTTTTFYINSSSTINNTSNSSRGGGGGGGGGGSRSYNNNDLGVEKQQRKKREAFTLQQKLQVLKFLETHSVNATSRFYKVDPKSIRLWRSQKIKIEQTVQEELQSLEQQGELEGITPRKRISGAGRKKRNKPVIVEIEENPNKRHRRTIKLSDKVEIIRLIEHGKTQSDVARSLGISQSTVQTIWSNKGEILERNSSPRKKRKNLHWKKYSKVDSALFNWVRQCRESSVILDTKMLHDKAIEYAEYYKQVSEFRGQASRWIDVFKRRHSLSSELDRQDRLQLSASTTTATSASISTPISVSSSHSLLLGVGGLEQHTLGQLTQSSTSSTNNHTLHHHQQQQLQSTSLSLLPHHQQQNSNHLDFVPDFDLSSLPGLMAGLYPPPPATDSSISQQQSQQHQISNGGIPSFNSHLPVISVPGGPVTTCDAMKYVELIRSWINSAFFVGETEEVLNNHLNAIENAVLKRRMTEMMAPPNTTTTTTIRYNENKMIVKEDNTRTTTSDHQKMTTVPSYAFN